MSQAKSQTNMCLANVSSLRSPSPMAPTPPPKKGLFRDKKSGKGAKNGVSTKLPPVTSLTPTNVQVDRAQSPPTYSPHQAHPIT